MVFSHDQGLGESNLPPFAFCIFTTLAMFERL